MHGFGKVAAAAVFMGAALAPALANAQAPAMKHIGVGILVTISPTTTALAALMAKLKDAGYVEGKTLTVDMQNAQNDQVTMRQIGQKFASENLDLIVAIGTVVAQNMEAATKTTPIVFSTVADPVGARLVQSLDHPGGNLSGSRLFPDFHSIVQFIKQIQPNLKTLGTIYTTAEPNSISQIAVLTAETQKDGITLVPRVALNSNDVLQAAQSLVGKVDATLLIQDNNSVSAIATVAKVAEDGKMPLYSSDTDSAAHGPIGSYGASVTAIGAAAGDIAVRVLKGENPADIPVAQVPANTMVVNPSQAAKMGVTIPPDILAKAVKVGG